MIYPTIKFKNLLPSLPPQLLPLPQKETCQSTKAHASTSPSFLCFLSVLFLLPFSTSALGGGRRRWGGEGVQIDLCSPSASELVPTQLYVLAGSQP